MKWVCIIIIECCGNNMSLCNGTLICMKVSKKFIWLFSQKQPFRGVPEKRFLKICIKSTGERPHQSVISVKWYFFQNNFHKKTFGGFLLYKDVSWQHLIIITGIFDPNLVTTFNFT